MAAALDERKDAIHAFMKTLPDDEDYRSLPLGPTVALHPKASPSPKSGWQDDPISWTSEYTRFEKIRSEPVNQEWLSLNHRVRSLIRDDHSRVVEGFSYRFNKDSGGQIRAALSEMKICLSEGRCDSQAIPLVHALIRQYPSFESHFTKAMNAPSDERRKELLKRFVERVQMEYVAGYGFSPSETIVRISPDTIQISLDASDFKGAEREFEEIIRSYWSSSGLSVKIRWAESSLESPLFHISFSQEPGERAFVDSELRKIQLYPRTRVSTIAHEFGHMLGFRDRYYTVWSKEQCGYVQQYNETDIMSESATGSVLPEHWEVLNNAYPWRR